MGTSIPVGQAVSVIQRVESTVLRSGVVVVSVLGDADVRIAPRLRAELDRLLVEGRRRIVVDLSTASFVDSAALGVLMGAAKRQRPLDGRIRVVVPSSYVRRIFELTLLDRLFGGLDTDVSEAVESLLR